MSIVDSVKESVEKKPLDVAVNELTRVYSSFPKVILIMAEAFSSDRLLGIYDRLLLEMSLVEKYKPEVRPALDPLFASTLRLYSLDHVEVGRFLGYPECCIKSFVNEGRMFFDEKHLQELNEIKKSGYKVVLTAGFVPCSLFCKASIDSGLLAHLKDETSLKMLDDELKKKLPHFHSAYESFYEYLS